MNIKWVTGDLIQMAKNGDFHIIIHGANCRNIMGTGIAAQIKQEFPEAYLADKNCKSRYPGAISHAITKSGLIVVNAYTQVDPGPCAKYDAIATIFRRLNDPEINLMGLKIGIPMIGCGIGGLKWPVVQTIIEEYAPNLDITCVIYDKG